jgi:hypothetical protein
MVDMDQEIDTKRFSGQLDMEYEVVGKEGIVCNKNWVFINIPHYINCYICIYIYIYIYIYILHKCLK